MSIKQNKTASEPSALNKLILISVASIAIVFSFILILSLLSYDINDPAWSHNKANGISNIFGVFGAWYSDISFSLIGYFSYLFPVAITSIAIRAIIKKRIDKEVLSWQLFMIIPATILGCIILVKHDLQAINSVALTGGGAVGAFLVTGLQNTIGSIPIIMLISISLFLLSIGLVFNISWIGLAEFIGEKVCQLFGTTVQKRAKPKKEKMTKAPDPLQEKIKFLNKMAEKKKKNLNPEIQIEPETSRAEINKRFSIGRNQNSNFDDYETDSNPMLDDPTIVEPVEPNTINTDIFESPLPTSSSKKTEQQTSSTNASGPSFFDFSKTFNNKDKEQNNTADTKEDNIFDSNNNITTNMSLDKANNPNITEDIIEPTPELSAFVEGLKKSRDQEANSQVIFDQASSSQPTCNYNNHENDSLSNQYNTQLDDNLSSVTQEKTQPSPSVTPLPTPPSSVPKVAPASNNTSIGRAYQAESESVKVTEKDYELPSINFLENPPPQTNAYTEDMLAEIADKLETTLKQFKLDATVMHVSPGPVITRFEIDLAPGVQAKKITVLSRDLARALAVTGVRVEEVIPGSSYVGLEVPNLNRQIVYFKDVLRSRSFQESKSPLTLSLGSDISGKPIVADLAKMPHLLVAGTTGSGKSVAINVMLLSMLYKASPKDLRLILVDPKMLEMSMYEDIPHLLTPVITDMNDAENALTWAVAEMERRYQLMAALKVRKIEAFNHVIDSANAKGESVKDPLWDPNESNGYTSQPDLERLPFIVIVIDELADMMMVVGKQVEQLIARLTQKARAAGIHVILATQRPSVDVLTGLIKANVPTRIAFQVSSKIDSRTIIDGMGAENLLGHGDMLYVPPGVSHPQRLHGAYINDKETDRITSFLRETGEPDYINGITAKQDPSSLGAFGASESNESKEDDDPLYQEAIEIVTTTGKASISSVQRQLRIGYNRAARMIEQMQEQGIVSEPVNGIRRVLKSGQSSS